MVSPLGLIYDVEKFKVPSLLGFLSKCSCLMCVLIKVIAYSPSC